MRPGRFQPTVHPRSPPPRARPRRTDAPTHRPPHRRTAPPPRAARRTPSFPVVPRRPHRLVLSPRLTATTPRPDVSPLMNSGEDSESEDSEDERDEQRRREVAVKLDLLRRRKRARAAKRQASGPRGPKRTRRSLFDWEEHLDRLSPREFKLRYRVDLASFEYLHNLLHEGIATKDLKQAQRSRTAQGEVTSRTRLAVALRYMAGGVVLDLSLIYHISNVGIARSRLRSRSHTCAYTCVHARAASAPLPPLSSRSLSPSPSPCVSLSSSLSPNTHVPTTRRRSVTSASGRWSMPFTRARSLTSLSRLTILRRLKRWS